MCSQEYSASIVSAMLGYVGFVLLGTIMLVAVHQQFVSESPALKLMTVRIAAIFLVFFVASVEVACEIFLLFSSEPRCSGDSAATGIALDPSILDSFVRHPVVVAHRWIFEYRRSVWLESMHPGETVLILLIGLVYDAVLLSLLLRSKRGIFLCLGPLAVLVKVALAFRAGGANLYSYAVLLTHAVSMMVGGGLWLSRHKELKA